MGKGLSIKDVRNQEGGYLSSADIFLSMGFSKIERPQKTSNFSKFIVCPHGQGGMESIFCNFLCGRFSWTAISGPLSGILGHFSGP